MEQRCRQDMNTEHFDQFSEFEKLGLADKAKQAVEAFVASVTSVEESRDWVFAQLPRLPRNRSGRIRHEIYVGVIFPVLFEGYRQGSARSKYWLATTHLNLLSAPGCHERIAHAGPKRLLQEALKSDRKNRQYQTAMLEHLISVFDFMDHEWPAGILSGANAMTDGWDELSRDIALARRLDRHRTYQDRLEEFADRVDAYRARLTA